LDQLPVADKPQAATVSPGAGDQSIRPRTSTPGPRRAWQQNQRKRFYSHELGIERMKGLRSKRVGDRFIGHHIENIDKTRILYGKYEYVCRNFF